MTCWILTIASILATPPAAVEDITFNKQIAPILWKNCAGCHRPGEVGPFSLLSYKDAAKRADFLKEVTESRQMPPWKPEPGYNAFHDERRLSDDEIATIGRWVDTGSKEGDLKDLPPSPKFPEGWQLGTPDLVLKMPEPFEVPATGRDVFRCFVLPMNVDENRRVSAVEFRPGNSKVVHHALFFLDSSGAARRKDLADDGPGFAAFGGPGFLPTGSLGGWAPGAMPRRTPENVFMRIPKGSDLALQVHYHPSGKPETDQSSIGIYFSKDAVSPASRLMVGQRLVNRNINIPPGDSHYELKDTLNIPVSVKLLGISPHMHLIGREMKVKAILPDGKEEPLIWIKDWDFNWQGQYQFARPVNLPAGSKIELSASYDNSASNPKNPSKPPQRVRFGEQTTDEMCFCFLQVVPDKIADYPALRRNLLPGAGGGGGAGALRKGLGGRLDR